MIATSRDAGLVREVGPWGLAASIVSIVVGAGIFAVPGALAAAVGPYAPLAFLLCGLAVGSVAICFAEGGSRIPTSGGVYGYIEAAFGPLVGYVAGTLLALTGTFAELAVLATLTTAALYAVGCAAAWLLARRNVAVAGEPLNFRWLGVAALAGVTGMVALIALGSWQEIAGLATLIGISVLVYLVTSRPQAARARSTKAGE